MALRSGRMAAVLLALSVMARSSADPPRRLTVQGRTFSFTVPRDWFPAALEQGRLRPLKERVPGPPRAGGVLTYGSPRGDYFMVELEPVGQGSEGDLRWTVEANGDRLMLLQEGPPCTHPPADFDGMDTCRIGDHRLTIEVVPLRLELKGHTYLLQFGNVLREEGVDLSVFREVLASFRAR